MTHFRTRLRLGITYSLLSFSLLPLPLWGQGKDGKFPDSVFTSAATGKIQTASAPAKPMEHHVDLSVLKEYYSVPFEDRKPYLHTLLKLLYREYIKIGRRFIATKQSDGSVTFQRNPGDRPIDPTAAIPPALFDSMTVIFAPLENLDGEEFNFFFSSSGLTNTVHLLGSVLHNMHHIMTGEGILLTEVPTALSVISEEDEEGEDAHAAEPGACTATQDEEPWQEVQTSKNMKKKRSRKKGCGVKNPPQYNGSTHATQSAI